MCALGFHRQPYLAVVLPLVLQHLLQVQTPGQVTLSQVVTELRDTEETLLFTHRFTAHKKEHTCQNKHFNLYLKCYKVYLYHL